MRGPESRPETGDTLDDRLLVCLENAVLSWRAVAAARQLKARVAKVFMADEASSKAERLLADLIRIHKAHRRAFETALAAEKRR